METAFLASVCPVRAAAEIFIHICFHKAYINTPICTYFSTSSVLGPSVNSRDIVDALCLWAAKLGFPCLGFRPKTIGSYLLRSGGGMTLNQSGISDITINVIGRWLSESLRIYLQGQVLSFTKGVVVAM